MEDLNSALHKFNQIVVEASRQACREAITFCMTQVILPLLEKTGDMDARFKCTSPMPNEAYFQGMKTISVNEFELIVILTDLASVKTFEDTALQDKSLSCYGHVVAQQATHFLDDVLVGSGLSHDFISAERVRGVFARLIGQAASILPLMGITLEVIYKDPYTVVKIFRGPDVYIFELVPAFAFPHEWPVSCISWCQEPNEWITEKDINNVKDMGFYAVALPCPASPSDPSLFRISFSIAEKYLLRPVPVEGSPSPHPLVRKDCERILKVLRESDKDDFSPVSSYHIKTMLLHECKRWPSPSAWIPERIGQRFLELFHDLILALENQDLPHFFVKDCNLLAFYASEKLAVAASRLRSICQDIYVAHGNSIRLQC